MKPIRIKKVARHFAADAKHKRKPHTGLLYVCEALFRGNVPEEVVLHWSDDATRSDIALHLNAAQVIELTDWLNHHRTEQVIRLISKPRVSSDAIRSTPTL